MPVKGFPNATRGVLCPNIHLGIQFPYHVEQWSHWVSRCPVSMSRRVVISLVFVVAYGNNDGLACQRAEENSGERICWKI